MFFKTLKHFSRTPLFFVYLLSFFYTLHVALPVYVNSTFLSTLIPERFIGLIYTSASLLAIISLALIPRLLKTIGDYFTTVFFIIFEILCLIGMAVSTIPALTITFFILSSVLIALIYFDLDLIVEKSTKNADTGSVRGLYLTFQNVAWVIAPAVAGALLVGGEYWKVYIAAAAIFIPALFIFAIRLDHFKDPIYRIVQFKDSLRVVSRNKDLRNIFSIAFLLQFFFLVMVIYTPIYLHHHIGFEWKELGILFSIMLAPFLLLEAILGRIADKILGEKELLVAGFIIMALATGAIFFFSEKTFMVWGLILFFTRVGAAMVEVMTETYFFKKIDSGDAAVVSLMRSIRPFAGIIGPLTATVFLLFFPIESIFLALGGFMLLGIPLAFALHDTR